MHNPDDLHGLAYAVGWEPYTLLDVAHVSRVGYAPYHTDPAQCILSACQGLDYLDHYLSDASIFQYPELLTHRIEGVLPSIPCHPGIFYADSERKASTYRPSKPCPIGLFFCRYRNRMVWTSIIVRCPSNNEISNLKPCSVSKGMRDHEYTPPSRPPSRHHRRLQGHFDHHLGSQKQLGMSPATRFLRLPHWTIRSGLPHNRRRKR